jgi:hypothetical protein
VEECLKGQVFMGAKIVSEGGSETKLVDGEDFEAREGDVLVVSYPEVTIPLIQYSTVKVGGWIYTRRMVGGESVTKQAEKVYQWLKSRCEKHATEKIATWAQELGKGRR